ncbi:unnamed protein product [Calypogeia fissa]
MEMPGMCAACGEERMVLDAIHGVLACDVCGTVGNQAETELRSEFQTGHVIERRGTYVGERDSGVAAAKSLMRGQTASHSFFSGYPRWSERHRLETMKKVESITALLRVPGDKVDQAKQLLESTLDGDWGTGRWVDILVAACVYIVIRQSQLPLTVPEVADCVNCDVVELGRMYNRVLQHLEISLPNVDPFIFLDRAASTLPAFRELNKDLVRKMKKQGTVLLDYAQQSFIATGRRPLPVVAAVLSLVVEANKVIVGIDEVARELHAGIWATKKRYKECQAALIGIGQSLPWAKDITLKTVPRHLPFLLQYLELKVKLEKKKTLACPGGEQPSVRLAGSSNDQQLSTIPQNSVAFSASDPVLSRHSSTTPSAPGNLRNPFKRSYDSIFSSPSARVSSTDHGDTFTNISNEENQQSQTALDTGSQPHSYQRSEKLLKMTGASYSGARNRSDGDSAIEINFSSADDVDEPAEDSSGITQSELVTKDSTQQLGLQMTPEPVLEQHKWEGLPAAFCANQEARTRRRVKIDLAKQRIAEARNGLKNGVGEASVDSSVSGQSVQEQSKANPEQNSKPNTSLDAEDLLIEHLVLRGASEADLENGYYRSLLALYPEQKDSEHDDDDPCSYIRSRSEVELLLELTGRQESAALCPPL